MSMPEELLEVLTQWISGISHKSACGDIELKDDPRTRIRGLFCKTTPAVHPSIFNPACAWLMY